MHVISIIYNHYLRQYDIDSSANFWRRAKSGDPVLWFFLVLHRRPYLFLFLELALLIFPSVYAYQHLLTGQPCPLLLGSPGPVIEKCPPALDSFIPEFIVVLIWYMLLLLFLIFLFLFFSFNLFHKPWFFPQ